MTAAELIQTCVEIEKSFQGVYKKYLQGTTSPGLRKLLTSLIEQEHDHEVRLGEIARGHDLQELFIPDILKDFTFSRYSNTIESSPDLSVNDIMNLIIKSEEESARMYSDISEMCLDESIGFLFTTLAFEENKHKNWAVDRYELELLSGF